MCWVGGVKKWLFKNTVNMNVSNGKIRIGRFAALASLTAPGTSRAREIAESIKI